MTGSNGNGKSGITDSILEMAYDVVRNYEVEHPSKSSVRQMVAAEDIEGLSELLEEEDWQDRVMAIRGLSLLGDARVIEPLIRGLMDEDERVRREASWALELMERRIERICLATR